MTGVRAPASPPVNGTSSRPTRSISTAPSYDEIKDPMKIYSAETWTIEELTAQIDDAGRRAIVVPAADSKQAVLDAFGELLDVPEDYGTDLDALHDSLHDVADTR